MLVSGVTVMIAMAGMYLAGASTFTSFATGTILVVAIAVIGSLTVLPAVLSKLGDRVDKGRIPFLAPAPQRAARESRVWSAILDRGAAPAAGRGGRSPPAVLLALAIPALNMKMAVPGIDSLPQDLAVIQTYDRDPGGVPGRTRSRPRSWSSADDAHRAQVRAAVERAARRGARATSSTNGPVTIDVQPGPARSP